MSEPARVGPARLGVALAALLATVATATASDGAAPRAVVEATTRDVLAVLAERSLSAAEKRERVERIVYANVDFEAVARLVLARNWRRFDEDQQREFIHEFKAHLSRTYGRNIDSYEDQRVEITGDRAEARGDWTVRTRVVRPGAEPVLVDYRLRPRDDAWHIIDIIVEGVSMIANFRAQFQDILANHDPDHLLRLLREKNVSNEPIA